MSEQGVQPEIEIMPRRLMPKKKADDLILLIKDTEHVIDVLIHSHSYKGGDEIIGRFFIRIADKSKADEVLGKLKPVFEQSMPFGYDVRIGRFTKTKPTIKDYLTGKTPG